MIGGYNGTIYRQKNVTILQKDMFFNNTEIPMDVYKALIDWKV